ncbi:hypothetical protein V8F20_011177 [Naviculisporaceae sp. PSN 640]
MPTKKRPLTSPEGQNNCTGPYTTREMDGEDWQYYQAPSTTASAVSSWVSLDYYQQEQDRGTSDLPSTGPSPLNDQYQEQLLSAASATPKPSTSLTPPRFSTIRVTETETVLVTVTIHRDGGDGHRPLSHPSVRQSLTTTSTTTTAVPGFHKDHFVSHDGDIQPPSNSPPPVKGPVSQTLSLISASGSAFLGSMGSIGESPHNLLPTYIPWADCLIPYSRIVSFEHRSNHSMAKEKGKQGGQ